MLIETEKDLHIVQMYTVPNLYNNHCIRRKSMLIETERIGILFRCTLYQIYIITIVPGGKACS